MEFYRYEDIVTDLDEVQIRLRTFQLIKETPFGYWIAYVRGRKKWMKKLSHRKYACLTKVEAMESFIARKKKQILILKAQLNVAEIALRQVEA